MIQRFLLTLGLSLLMSFALRAQVNLISDPGYETLAAGTSSYTTTSAGTVSGTTVQGKWQLTFVTGTCTTTTVTSMSCVAVSGCSSGSSVITTADKNSGSKSLYVRITKQTNRNDIKLYQVLSQSVAAGSYEVSFYMKSDGVSQVTLNVFKSGAGATANGGESQPVSSTTYTGTASSFTSTTGWRRYRAVVDLSQWNDADRASIRISIRPNTGVGTTGTSLPQGPCPKQFWFDDFLMRPASTTGTLSDLRLTAIQVARERQELAANAGFTEEANALLTEISSLTATTTPLVPDKAIGFYPAPLHTTSSDNPFIQSLNSWAGTYLGQSFPVYTKSTSASMVFPGGRGLAPTIRETGATAESLYWLLVSPFSEYRYNPDLFYRFLHILYASADDYSIHGASGEIDEVPGSTTNGLNDWFAAPMFAYGWRMGDYSFADYIPETFKNRLRGSADIMGGIYYTIAQTGLAGGTYVNRDVSYAEVLAHTGLYRSRTDWTDFARTLVTSLNTRCIYPDGAYSYIREQNETANYHGGTNNSLAKIHSVLDVPEALTAIAKTVNYELISIEPAEVPEFYTAPSWKTQWNGQSGYSGEPLLFLTQNPYLKGQFDTFKALFGAGYNPMYRKILPTPLNVSFYRNDITAKPLPDNYVVYDRNIQGPRGRYGRFSYAISGRDVDAGEPVNTTSVSGSVTPGGLPGMQTFVGAMVTQAGRQTVNGVNRDEYNAALLAVQSKVHVRTAANQEWRDWVYTTTRINPKTTVTKTAATFSSPGNLQRQNTGPSTFDSDWATYQQWITLPDRLIGVVETFPKGGNPAKALEIDGRVRLTYGRAELTNPKNITVLEADKRFAYGNLQTIIHDHDFSTVSTATGAGILRDDYPTAAEIILRYNLSDGTNLYTYPGNTRKYFIVEIRQSGASGEATVSRLSDGDLKGLVVNLNGQTYRSFRNLGSGQLSVDLSTSLTAGTIHKVYYARNDNELQTPQSFTTTSLSLAANEQVFLVSGNRGEPLSNGLNTFNTLLSAMDTEPGAQLLASENGILSCTSPLVTLAVSTSATTGPLTYAFSGPGNSTSGIVSSSGSSATVNAAGVYSVTVTNTASGLSSTGSVTITRSAPVTATLSSSTLTCALTTATLTASATGGSGSGYTYRLSTGESNTLGSFTVNAADTYSLTVTDGMGCSATASTTVTSGTALPAITAFSVNQTLTCAQSSVTLTATAMDVSAYTVIGPDAFRQTTANGQFTVTDPGIYTLLVSHTASGCTSATTTTVTQSTALPSITLTASALTICSGNPVSVTAIADLPGTTFVWSTGSTSAVVTESPASATTYSVTATHDGCTKVASVSIAVNLKAAILNGPAGMSVVCLNRPVSTAVSTSGLVSGYQWYRNGLPVSGQLTETFSLSSARPEDSGDYTVAVTGSCNSVTSATFSLTVQPAPSLSIAVSAATIVPGEQVTLVAGGNASAYTWLPGNVTSGSLVAKPTETTTYTLTGSTNDCPGYTTATVSVTCDMTRTASAMALTQPRLLARESCTIPLTATGFGNSFTLSGPDGFIYSAVFRQGGAYTLTIPGIKQPGTYTMTVTFTNDCGIVSSDSKTITVTGTACP